MKILKRKINLWKSALSVATKHEHQAIAWDSPFVLEVYRDDSPYFTFVPPPLCAHVPTHTNTHSFVLMFLPKHRLMMCMGERKQGQMSLCSDIMWMLCVMLCCNAIAGQATPMLLRLVSASKLAIWCKAQWIQWNRFSRLQSRLLAASLANATAENIWLLHGAGQDQ